MGKRTRHSQAKQQKRNQKTMPPEETTPDTSLIENKDKETKYQTALETVFHPTTIINPNEDQGDGHDAYGNYLLKKNKVILFRDHHLEFPELNLRILLVGPPEDIRGFPALFARAQCTAAKNVAEADLVVFGGGPDVDPVYYDETKHETVITHGERDCSDIGIYLECAEAGVPMLGICRGAQFLAVMNGYKLVQHMNGHMGNHKIWDKKTKRLLESVSSVHHQGVIPDGGMDVIAIAYESTEKWLNHDKILYKNASPSQYPVDVEAFFIRSTCCLGVQGHPEYKGYNEFAKWTLELIEEYIILNPDIDWAITESGDTCRRLKEEFINERNASMVMELLLTENIECAD